MDIKLLSDIDWQGWIERWDRMQDHYILFRKDRFELMVRLIADAIKACQQALEINPDYSPGQ